MQGNRVMRLNLLMMLAVSTGLSACVSTGVDGRRETAHRLAASGGLSAHAVDAGGFRFQIYERYRGDADMVRVYIEGDGYAWVSRSRPSGDPTPMNPVALRLAAVDDAGSVAYLARPCQYYMKSNGKRCDRKYWMGARFAPEVIAAMDGAIDEIKRRSGAQRVELVGFSGGGAVVSLLTARRADVSALRSVAGNLDHVALHRHHKVSQIPESLNAADVAHRIAHVPQVHFVGAQDDVVGGFVYESYRAKMGESSCASKQRVEGASHGQGWAQKWRALLKVAVRCR